MKLDLHCHTYYSDGTQSPTWVAQRAAANAVTHLAITDHDHLTSTVDVPTLPDLQLIPGIEISSNWGSREIHVVGLFVDQANEALNALVKAQQALRRSRVEAMAAKLEALGTLGLMEYLDDLSAVAYTRSHVANFLVEQGLVKNRQQAFKQYLAKGGRAYVPAQWCSLDEAVSVIDESGGISILAHPGRYPLNKRQLAELVETFVSAGGAAMEVRYPNIDPNMTRHLEQLATEHKLFLSGGSDFHDPEARWTDIGKFPPIRGEAELRSVQNHPRWVSLSS